MWKLILELLTEPSSETLFGSNRVSEAVLFDYRTAVISELHYSPLSILL